MFAAMAVIYLFANAYIFTPTDPGGGVYSPNHPEIKEGFNGLDTYVSPIGVGIGWAMEKHHRGLALGWALGTGMG